MAEQITPERRAEIRRGAEWIAANYIDTGRGASRMLVETADVLALLDALDAADVALAGVVKAWWAGAEGGDTELIYPNPEDTLDAIWDAIKDVPGAAGALCPAAVGDDGACARPAGHGGEHDDLLDSEEWVHIEEMRRG